jgi:hypothetical protein
MRKNKKEDIVKLFGITNQMLELDLNRIEKKYDLDLGRVKTKVESDNIYYPQFDLEIRKEAKKMAKNYELFYCLEKSIRNLINTALESDFSDNWWEEPNVVPDNVRTEVKKRINKEIDSAVTLRSDNPIDFTTFGELGEIVKANWTTFNGIGFKSVKAFEGVMSKLKTIRGPIAHCSDLAEDEELRLQLTIRDWFRLME